MKLTRLYGNTAIEFHDGRLNYKTKSGAVDLPDHLVQRAINAGFSRMRPSHLAPTMEDPAPEAPAETPVVGAPGDPAPVTDPVVDPDAPPVIPSQPATQVADLPPGHPQTDATTAIATREALESRLRSQRAAT